MCVMCSKFDFDVNIFCWLGCDVCLYWIYLDCVMRGGVVVMGLSIKVGFDCVLSFFELIFWCRVCGSVFEFLGWVRDVF